MPVEVVTDANDVRLTAFRHLKATNHTRWRNTLVAEGDKLVRRLIECRLPVESLLVSDRYLEEFRPLVGPEVPILVGSHALIEQLVGFNFHRGVIACAQRPPAANLETICQKPNPVLIVATPEIHDPENLGAILRLSAAFGVAGLALGPGSCDPFARRVLRVSMGAAFRVPIVRSLNLAAELQRLRERVGLQTWATVTSTDATPFDATAKPEKLALLLGSEGHGLPAEWQEFADQRITIPMRPGTDSLNVATAAGILLYHFSRSQ